ncbi:hypothetical protein K504DRAFT_433752 [Pleomassaria siparia CBS 279.74]|uniref:C2H2-type domain-containing protein n=1 Tax=Pleomassaria siparia CBS 279.74 TaxID=1314801 RepID=A0A6G1K857_9PLEO|nr:hypothetical protein K504DRAFT_433752 [Pleomassaria siparia CBS 279.74]
MAMKGVNRFALFQEEDEDGQKLKTRVQQSAKPHYRTLVICDNKHHSHVAHNRPAIKSNSHAHAAADMRKASSSTDSTDRSYNANENWCGVCSLKLPTKSLLLSHIKQTPNHQNYCNLCKRVFKDRNGLQNHVDNAIDHDVFCNLCLSAFKDKWGLRNHFENNYSVGHEFACLTCLMGFRTRNQMERHLRTARKHVRCDTCHRDFQNQDERDEHWRITTKHKHCLQPGCDFDGPNISALDKHLSEDHFECDGCHMIFASQTKLTAHVESCSFNVPCDRCGEIFPGRPILAAHQENCFSCEVCKFHTTHEGNFEIHVTKHSSATLACWACDIPMRTHSSLISHLESGKCPNFVDPTIIMRTLGTWWYSPLYMDLDIHAQIRTARTDMKVIHGWMAEGLIHPFVCRGEGCGKAFARFSSLVLHVESQACDWDVPRLGFAMLEREIKREIKQEIKPVMRKDSTM